MCLLIFKPENVTIPHNHLVNADYANPHGCGIAFPDGKVTRTLKGAKWGADEIGKALATIGTAPAVIHFRFATHGSQVDSNTHPFLLPRGVAAAHNGVIGGVECRPDESDTRAYLRQHVSPSVGKGQDITDQLFLDCVGAQVGAGNKLVFLDGKGRHGIANEKSGHWHAGAWYSNTTYKQDLYSWSADYEDEEAIDSWHEREVAELCCQYCGEHVSAMAFGKTVLIDPETGNLLCGGCAQEERDRQRPAASKYKLAR